jgi:hypothetical protein
VDIGIGDRADQGLSNSVQFDLTARLWPEIQAVKVGDLVEFTWA